MIQPGDLLAAADAWRVLLDAEERAFQRASSRRTQWNLNVQHGRFVTPVPIPAKENLRPTPHPALLRQQCVSTIGVRGLAFSDRPFGYNTIAAWPESARPLGFGWRSEGEVGLLVAPR